MAPKRSVTCVLVLLLLAGVCQAQSRHTIQGKITDTSGAAVPDAAVLLEQLADSSLIKAAVPDAQGHYTLTAGSLAGTRLRVTAPGFREEVRTITDTVSEITKLYVVLKPAGQALAGVTVSGRKPLIERKTDRTIFNVAESLTATGGHALDAIRKAPGVTVRSGDNAISLVGKSEVQVLINGRLLQLSGEDLAAYLQAIPSENLERIEVITAPPARYDAAGNAGLLNLVLKKNPKQGLNGDARIGYEQAGYGRAITGGSLNYRNGRLNVYASAGYFKGANDITERLNTPYPDQFYRLSDHYKRTTASLQYTVGADYELHKSGVLGVQLTGSDFDRVYDEDIHIRMERYPAYALDSLVHTDATSRMATANNSININYAWQIDTSGRKLTINANRLWFASDREKDLETRNYAGPLLMPTGVHSIVKNIGDQDIAITTVQADAELPVKWAALSFGGKWSQVENDSRNQFLQQENGVFQNNPSISNAFRYSEQIGALYAGIQKSAGKWEFQGGLRGELTRTSGYSANLNQTNTNQYFNLFPTAYIQYKVNDDHVINGNFSKRVNRPGYRALDPFRSYTTPYSYTEGNPFLQPSYAHALELNYNLKGKYTLTAFYQLEQEHFGQVFLVDTVHKTQNMRWENFADAHFYGLSAMASLQPAKWWETQVQVSGVMQELHSGYYTGPEQSYQLPFIYAMVNNSLALNKKRTLLAEVNVFYQSRSQSDFLYLNGRGSLDTGIRALLLDKKLILSLNATDLLATQRTQGVNEANGQIIDSYFDVRNVRLMVNYKFGNRKLPARRERATGIEEEKSRT